MITENDFLELGMRLIGPRLVTTLLDTRGCKFSEEEKQAIDLNIIQNWQNKVLVKNYTPINNKEKAGNWFIDIFNGISI